MNRVAIVTGASRGIGREIAKSLARMNIQVVGNYNQSEKEAIELKDELKKENIEIDIFKADVSKRDEIKKMVDYTIEKYGKVDILVNNAGIDLVKEFTKVTDEDWDKIINTNLYSAFAMSQETLPSMIHQKSGCIINISSIWGLVGSSCEVLYSISKAGVDGLTKALAKELGPSNIRVNSIAPGFIDTRMNENIDEETTKEIIRETPLLRTGKPIDIARCIEWLINDEFTTGQVISINGGWII
ncbi:MAG: 3-oxoacyl-ACP reductase FabG [Clostridia bacterium]|nr:3-oxoacyl-ACP reductase FabG [Clostridia bacterium]MBR6123925.1 3-oxoacyl-ACP reductase FabG [Candidatus Saccharibacteria bacterium]